MLKLDIYRPNIMISYEAGNTGWNKTFPVPSFVVQSPAPTLYILFKCPPECHHERNYPESPLEKKTVVPQVQGVCRIQEKYTRSFLDVVRLKKLKSEEIFEIRPVVMELP